MTNFEAKLVGTWNEYCDEDTCGMSFKEWIIGGIELFTEECNEEDITEEEIEWNKEEIAWYEQVLEALNNGAYNNLTLRKRPFKVLY